MTLDLLWNTKKVFTFTAFLSLSAVGVRDDATEVCVGITQMLEKSISRFLTLGITLSIAIVLLFLSYVRIGCQARLGLLCRAFIL